MSKYNNPIVAYNFIRQTTRDLADMISKLDNIKQQLRWCSEAQDWDSLIEIELDEVHEKLGVALASFVTWYDTNDEDEILKKKFETNDVTTKCKD